MILNLNPLTLFESVSVCFLFGKLVKPSKLKKETIFCKLLSSRYFKLSYAFTGAWTLEVCNPGLGVVEASGGDEAAGANGQDQGIWGAHRTG